MISLMLIYWRNPKRPNSLAALVWFSPPQFPLPPTKSFFLGGRKRTEGEHFGFQNSPIFEREFDILWGKSLGNAQNLFCSVFPELGHVEFFDPQRVLASLWHLFLCLSLPIPPPFPHIYTLWKEKEKIVGKKREGKGGGKLSPFSHIRMMMMIRVTYGARSLFFFCALGIWSMFPILK